jgi:two-component system LytT family response regulator
MTTALIVDDERHARLALRGLLEENFSDIVQIIGECKDVPEAVRSIQQLRPQIVFLDVEMPEYNGFDLIDFFRPEQIDFEIIFVTAYSEYSLRAFEISAIDYLLKPVRVEQLERALKKVRANQPLKGEQYKTLQENLREEVEKKLVIQDTENIFILKFSDIYYLEASGSYTKFYVKGRNPILISKKMAEFEYLEQFPHFFRTHRSFLINIEKIKTVNKKTYVIEMENGETVALAQDKKKSLLDKLSVV